MPAKSNTEPYGRGPGGGRGRLPNTIRTFWCRVNKNGPIHPVLGTACWVWTGRRDRDGYGRFCIGRMTKAAHRVAWEDANGVIGPDLGALHHCDNRGLCNPSHMFLGNNTVNHADCVAKKRHPAGERHGRAKLTEDAVREIRTSTESHRVLADRFGVSRSMVGQAKRGLFWKHVQ